MTKTIAVAYIPVLHKGYFEFLAEIEKRGVTELFLLGDEILEAHEELDYINRKDRIRALSLSTVEEALSSITPLVVKELTLELTLELQKTEITVMTPREDIGRIVVENYFKDKEVEYIDIFLRWNKDNIGEEKEPVAKTVSLSDFQKNVCEKILTEAAKSFDWWRQVGAVLIKNDEVVCIAHNEHMPEKQQPNIDGDTRALFKKGIHINYVTAAHAEVVAIATAAKNGISTDGAELFVTDFPCPYCARLIAKAGIKKVYFIKGYAVLEGDEFLRGEGVQVVQVRV